MTPKEQLPVLLGATDHEGSLPATTDVLESVTVWRDLMRAGLGVSVIR
jgi:hypothetical protein